MLVSSFGHIAFGTRDEIFCVVALVAIAFTAADFNNAVSDTIEEVTIVSDKEAGAIVAGEKLL